MAQGNKHAIPPPIWTALGEEADRRGITVAQVLKEKVKDSSTLTTSADMPPLIMGNPSRPTVPPARVSLDEAAEVFLSRVPPPQAELIRTLCEEHVGRKPWQYLLTYIVLAYERREVAAFMSESEVAVAESDEPIQASTQYVCQFCHKSFVPTRRGQKYCPDPEDDTVSCGRQASLEMIHQMRPQTPSLQHRLAAQAGFGR